MTLWQNMTGLSVKLLSAENLSFLFKQIFVRSTRQSLLALTKVATQNQLFSCHPRQPSILASAQLELRRFHIVIKRLGHLSICRL